LRARIRQLPGPRTVMARADPGNNRRSYAGTAHDCVALRGPIRLAAQKAVGCGLPFLICCRWR